MPMTEERLDAAFTALSDPTCRAIVSRLARGDATVSELAAPFDMSLPGISKHLKVLERGGLISRRRERGSFVRATSRRAPSRVPLDWMEKHRRLWEERFDRLDTHLRHVTARDGTAGSDGPTTMAGRSRGAPGSTAGKSSASTAGKKAAAQRGEVGP